LNNEEILFYIPFSTTIYNDQQQTEYCHKENYCEKQCAFEWFVAIGACCMAHISNQRAS